MLSRAKGIKFNIFKFTKVSLKITIIYAFLFSCILLILNASILYGVKYYLNRQGELQATNVGITLLSKINELDNTEENIQDKDFFADVPTNNNIYISIFDGNGTVINSSGSFKYAIPLKEPYGITVHMVTGGKHIVYENIRTGRDNSILYIQIVKDMDSEYHFLEILFILMAIADAAGIMFSILIGFILSKRMLKPIDNITRTARSISINNLKERIEIKGPDDELRRLAKTFNDMIDRLQDSFERQVQFVSDASHELRTPISVIQGYTDLLNRWGKEDKTVLEESITAIKDETSNMGYLVEKLLFLAGGDSGAQRLEKEEFFINELIDEVIKESKLITDKHKIMSVQNDAVLIIADRKLLKQMLRIFIDNSIKFTPENGEILINSIIRDNKLEISVEDTGVGIPKEDIPRIFDRFYRVDKSRTKEKGGSGLGLSIAKWIADAHNGSITVESKTGKGTKVSVIIQID